MGSPSLSARPLAFLSTLNLSSRFWMYCGPDLWLYIPSQVSGQLLKQGTQGSPQTEPWTCWSAHCGISPSCEAPQEAGSSTAVDCSAPGRRQGCGSGSERLAIWKEYGFLEPCTSVLVPGVAVSFQSCSPFSWVRYSTREDGDVDHQEAQSCPTLCNPWTVAHRGRRREDPMPKGWWPRGVTPRPRSGAAAESARLQGRRNG